MDVSGKRKKARTRFFIESLALVLIVISPFVFKAHEYLPTDPDATINILGFVMDRNGFSNINIYIWFLLGKIVPLYLLFIWFLTCKHWWYHIILIPMTMYAFQIFEVFYTDDKYVDTKNVLWLLPVCMVVIPFVYLIRIKLYDKYVHGIDLEAMESELKALQEDPQVDSSMTKRPEEDAQDLESEEHSSLSESVDRTLTTKNLQKLFKRFRHTLQSWL